MKEILITGSEGFVGQHLRTEMENAGYDVSGTTLNSDQADQEKKIFACDVTDYASLKELIEKLVPDFIIHLAAISAPARSFKEPQKTLEVNTIGTLNLLEAVKSVPNYSPRILIVGTSEEYGFVPEEHMPVTETEAFNPASPYSVSKLAAYHLSKIYYRCYGQDIIYVSAFNHTGYGQGLGFLTSEVAMQIAKIEKGLQEPIVYTGNVDSERDYTDVKDIVRAYRLLLEKGRSGERYNVCSGRSVSIKEVVEKLISISDIKIDHKVDPQRNRPSEMRILRGSHEKITNDVGWNPEITLDETLADLLKYYREINEQKMD